MSEFVDKMQHFMRNGLTIKDMHEILVDLISDGYGDAMVGFRIGHTQGSLPAAITFPLADLRVLEDKSTVIFTPAPAIMKFKDRYIPEFDFVVSFENDAMKLKIEEILFA